MDTVTQTEGKGRCISQPKYRGKRPCPLSVNLRGLTSGKGVGWFSVYLLDHMTWVDIKCGAAAVSQVYSEGVYVFLKRYLCISGGVGKPWMHF